MLNDEMPTRSLLGAGFVRLRNIAGPMPRTDYPFCARDVDVPQTARKSFDRMGADYSYEDEMRLADYLYRNLHTTPFEMIETWWDVKVPICVDRHMVRHRTWSRDEASARYVVLPNDYYVPKPAFVSFATTDKKQGGRTVDMGNPAEVELAEDFTASLRGQCRQSYKLYEHYISRGIAAEQARMFLHVNHFVEWTGKVDLHNLFHFLTLRTHHHAQYETRVYAWAMVDLLKPHIPGLMSLWLKYETVRRPVLE